MSGSFPEYVRDQLEPLGGVTLRRMFGGHGVYRSGVFFAILYRDRLYFKTDAHTRVAYEAREMTAFRPSRKQTLANYYEVPVDVLEEAPTLVEWAREALRVATTSSPARRRSAKRRRD